MENFDPFGWPNVLAQAATLLAASRRQAASLREQTRQTHWMIAQTQATIANCDSRLQPGQPRLDPPHSHAYLTNQLLAALAMLEQSEAQQCADLARTRALLAEIRGLSAEVAASEPWRMLLPPPAVRL